MLVEKWQAQMSEGNEFLVVAAATEKKTSCEASMYSGYSQQWRQRGRKVVGLPKVGRCRVPGCCSCD